MNTNGAIFYENDSIVGIITGLAHSSHNTKTGAMLQTWILVKNVNPIEAVNTGADELVCGDCKHRGTVEPVNDTKDKKSYSYELPKKTIKTESVKVTMKFGVNELIILKKKFLI